MEVLEARLAPATVFALDHADHLVVFASDAPGEILATIPLQGLLRNDHLVALDATERSGELKGLSNHGQIYIIGYDGRATPNHEIGSSTLFGDHFGFSEKNGREWILSDRGQQLSGTDYYYSTYAPEPVPEYAASDPHAGETPRISGAAWSSGTTPVFYGLDTATDSLVRVDGAVVTTVGELGVDTLGEATLNILADGSGLAVLTVGDVPRMYRIDLATGQATLLGMIGSGDTPVASFGVVTRVSWTGGGLTDHWSEGANWSTGFAPTAGDSVTIYNSSFYATSVNDLPAYTPFKDIYFSHYPMTLTGQPVSLSGTLTLDEFATRGGFQLPIRCVGDASIAVGFFGDGKLPMPLDLNGHTLSISGEFAFGSGLVDSAGGGKLHILNKGMVTLAAQPSVVSATSIDQGGELDLGGGSLSGSVYAMGLLEGSGSTGSVVLDNQGRLVPGHDTTSSSFDHLIGAITIHGDYTEVYSLGGLTLKYAGPDPGQYDRLTVTGRVTLVHLPFFRARALPDQASGVIMLNNQGGEPIAAAPSTFNNMFAVQGRDVIPHLNGGDGNDLSFTSLAPAHAVLTGASIDAAFASTVTFHVHLSRPTLTGGNLLAVTADGTARAGGDYSGQSQTVTASSGSDYDITVPIARTLAVHEDRQFALQLSGGNVVYDQASAIATIHYSGLAGTKLGTTAKLEGSDETMLVPLKLPQSYPQDLTFSYTLNDGTAHTGTDYSGTGGTVTIRAGQTTALISVPLTGDRKPQGNRDFTVQVTGPGLAEPLVARELILDDDLKLRVLHATQSDGSVVTVRDTLGRLNPAMLVSGSGFDFGTQLWGERLRGDQITISLAGSASHRLIDYPVLRAEGTDLSLLRVRAELEALTVGSYPESGAAVKQLYVAGLAPFASSGAAVKSMVHGSVKTLSLGRLGAPLEVDGKVDTASVQNILAAATGDDELTINGSVRQLTLGEMSSAAGVYVGGSIRTLSAANPGRLMCDGNVGTIDLGSMIGSSLTVGGSIVSLHVHGSIEGTAEHPVELSVYPGNDDASSRLIGSMTVDGHVYHAELLVGCAKDGSFIAGGVSVGKVTVRGDWMASDLAVGVFPDNEGHFGTPGSTSGFVQEETVLKQLTIGGEVLASGDDPGGPYGITASVIGSVSVHGKPVALTPGKDTIALTTGGTVTLKEVR